MSLRKVVGFSVKRRSLFSEADSCWSGQFRTSKHVTQQTARKINANRTDNVSVKDRDVKILSLVEGVQGDLETKEFSIDAGRKILEESLDYSLHGPSIQGAQGGRDQILDTIANTHKSTGNMPHLPNAHAETYSCSGNISLHGCMQSNVPAPYNAEDSHNETIKLGVVNQGSPQYMPGSGDSKIQKYASAGQNDINTNSFIRTQKRSFHSDARRFNIQMETRINTEAGGSFPQGIQGDHCVQHKLWMENCLKYHLPNCDEQFQSMQSGRKTLAQVFAEQEKMISRIANDYKQSRLANKNKSGNMSFSASDFELEYDVPVPQGIQGDNCAGFKLWLKNCNRYGIEDSCADQINSVNAGRKTLQQIFREQDQTIRSAVVQFQQRRKYSTSNQNKGDNKDSEGKNTSSDSQFITPESETPKDTSTESPVTPPESETPLSQRAKLKNTVAQYGSTVIVFHIGISLMSLGGFYLLVDRYDCSKVFATCHFSMNCIDAVSLFRCFVVSLHKS